MAYISHFLPQISKKGNFPSIFLIIWGSKIAFLGISFLGNWITKKGNFDGLYKQFSATNFQKRKFSHQFF
jgi:hypothetical protein